MEAAVPGRPQNPAARCPQALTRPQDGSSALQGWVGRGGAAGHGDRQFATILEGVEPEVRLRDWTLQRCRKDTPRPGVDITEAESWADEQPV